MAHGAQMPWSYRAVCVDTGGALYSGSARVARRHSDYDPLHLSRENKDSVRKDYLSCVPQPAQRFDESGAVSHLRELFIVSPANRPHAGELAFSTVPPQMTLVMSLGRFQRYPPSTGIIP